MPRLDPDDLPEADLVRVFIAATLKQAREAETLLTSQGVHYVVQAEPIGRTLFGSPRQFAVFYVVAEDVEVTQSVLVAAGLEAGVIRK